MTYDAVYSTTPQIITNSDGSYGNGLPVFAEENLIFPYNLELEDYFTGSVQFLRVVTMEFDASLPGTTIGFAESVPRRYEFGEYSIMGANGHVQERGKIDAEKWVWRQVSEPYPLADNEAARYKEIRPSVRPRATFENTFESLPNLEGRVRAQPSNLTGFTNLVAPPNSGTTNGTIDTALNSTAFLRLPTGSLDFHMVAADIRLTFTDAPPGYRTFENLFGNNPDIQPAKMGIYLNPGVIGAISYTVMKCGVSIGAPPTAPPIYTPPILP